MIEKLQNNYDIAIRSSLGNVEEMKKAGLPSYFYFASSESCFLHQYCPVGLDSYCGFKKDKTTYKRDPGLFLLYPRFLRNKHSSYRGLM